MLTKYFGTRQHVGSLQNRRAASWASEQVAKSVRLRLALGDLLVVCTRWMVVAELRSADVVGGAAEADSGA
eukprot:COSAG01_NODE_5126_length_4469_cov_14.074600_7_plen_71_part_00